MILTPVTYNIDSAWLHEFIGLFNGEGHILLKSVTHRRHVEGRKEPKDYASLIVSPELRMDLHPRELATLREVQSHLGGSLKWYDNPDSNYGRFRWLLSSWGRVGPLARLMVQQAVLHMPKLDELAVLADLYDYRLTCGHKLTADQREHIQAVRQQLMDMRNIFDFDVSGFQGAGGKTASGLPLTVRAKKLQHSFP